MSTIGFRLTDPGALFNVYSRRVGSVLEHLNFRRGRHTGIGITVEEVEAVASEISRGLLLYQ